MKKRIAQPARVRIDTLAYETTMNTYRGVLYLRCSTKRPVIQIDEKYPYETDGIKAPDFSGCKLIGRQYEKTILKLALEKLSENWAEFVRSWKEIRQFPQFADTEFCDRYNESGRGRKFRGHAYFTFGYELWLPQTWNDHLSRAVRIANNPGKGRTTASRIRKF